jgi:hypothetical protein
MACKARVNDEQTQREKSRRINAVEVQDASEADEAEEDDDERGQSRVGRWPGLD